MLSQSYSAFIGHYLQAKDALKTAQTQKPAFSKFLEVREDVGGFISGRIFALAMRSTSRREIGAERSSHQTRSKDPALRSIVEGKWALARKQFRVVPTIVHLSFRTC